MKVGRLRALDVNLGDVARIPSGTRQHTTLTSDSDLIFDAIDTDSYL
jgi:hypothetical protein